MIIKSISLKNFKSFGNNIQSIEFKENSSDLILLSSENGGGKSSFQQSFDFSLFGIVRGKNGSKVTQKILPNRINKNLETEIQFTNNMSDIIRIQRCLEPNHAKVFINDIDETRKFKNLKKEDRDKLIGFDYDTYKSFISMSVSDFANFIDLNPEDKRNIINRLFNLQNLDEYLNLNNGLIKQNKEEELKLISIIETNEQTIKTLNQNIINIKRSGILDKEKEREKLEIEKNSKREPYINYKKELLSYDDKFKKLDQERQDFENQRNIISNDIIEIKVEIKNIEEKLEIYESGICPLCNTDLSDENHKHDLSDINYKLIKEKENFKKLNSKKDSLTLKLTQISNDRDSLYNQKNIISSKYNNLIYELKIITKKISDLIDTSDHISIVELEKNIEELKNNNIKNNNKIIELNNKNKIYEELKYIFSTNGVRKSIVQNIVKPINVYLKEILDDMKSTYNVKIDENFNVKIYERLTTEIHPESLSMGESKKINIGIALSYLKLILKFRKLNILFLDEVFSSMGPINVEYALKVLKDFTKEFNINIIILDPKVYFTESSSMSSYFDRILKITKKMSFSVINEENI